MAEPRDQRVRGLSFGTSTESMRDLDALATLVARLDLAVAVLAPDGRFAACNEAFEVLFGYRAEELVGRNPESLLVPAEEADEARELWRRARAGIEGRTTTRRLAGDGGERQVKMHLVPHLVADEVRSIWAVYEDLSERHALAEQLRQAQKMEAIGHLAGGIAHDFNNLLTAMVGYAEIMELSLHDEGLRRYAREIRRVGERAGRLTHHLLAFTRKHDLRPARLNLNTVVIELENILRRLIGERIEIRNELEPELGIVWADRDQLEQVIINLVVNARDAMPDGGTLTFTTVNVELDETAVRDYPACRPGPFVQLSVRDTGCGMDAETQARIFDPFFTTKTAGNGTGLGLAGVYGIVTRNDGYVQVDSEPGAGSTFAVGLPRLVAAETGLLPPDPSGIISYGGETILLVEDDRAVRQATRDFLELTGYRVLAAAGEAEALAAIRDHGGRVDLLLTDVVMPDTTGPALAHKLKSLCPEMKILYQSGYLDNEVVRQGPEPGSGYLQKPVRPKKLTQKIREILNS